MTEKREGTTKESILMAAFAQLTESLDFKFSLSKTAKKTGISKAAIFRHYKNKDALLAAMSDAFFDDLAGALYKRRRHYGGGVLLTTHDILGAVIRFLTEHMEYLGYIRLLCSTQRDLDSLFEREFTKRGFPRYDNTPPDAAGIYAFTTIVFYVLQYWKGTGPRPSPEAFERSLMSFLQNGWAEIRALSDEEKIAYNARCVVEPSALPKENRFFSALMAVVFRHGFLGITIERIAGELGMTKSSLYAFFKNKETLINNVMEKEMAYLVAFLSEKLYSITDVSGAVYMYLQLVYHYLMARPAVIPIIVWHFTHGGKLKELYQNIALEDVGEGLRLVAELKNAEFDMALAEYSTAAWLASLPASLIIHQHKLREKQFSAEEGYNMIAKMYWQIGHPLSNKSECVLPETGQGGEIT